MKKITIEYDNEAESVDIVFLYKDIAVRGGFTSNFLYDADSFRDILMNELVDKLKEVFGNEKKSS